jgi:hypothetical protein
MIRFACRTCHERLAVSIRYAGRKGRCPACDAVNEVPTVSEFPEPVVPAATITPQRSGPAANAPAPRAPADPRRPSATTAPSSSKEPQEPVPWSAPEPKRSAPIPEVAPIFDDEPAQMVEMSAYEDAAGISTVAKVLIAIAILAGIAGIIWGASFLFIWSKSRGV